VQKDKPASVLGEALLDAVIAPSSAGLRRTGARRAQQPLNTFINRSGEIASDLSTDGPSRVFRPAPSPKKGEG
jgi:hypothetical protein